MKKDLQEYAWLRRGRQRRVVIMFMTERPATAEELRRQINELTALKLSLREMSRHVTTFARQGIAECLTPDAPYDRLYVLTRLGHRLRKALQPIGAAR